MKIQRRLVEAKSNFTNDDYYNVKRLSKEELDNIIKNWNKPEKLNDEDRKSRLSINLLLQTHFKNDVKELAKAARTITGKDLAGMVAEELFKNVIDNDSIEPFKSFFKGSNGKMMYTVLDDFTDAMGANSITNSNKFITEFINKLKDVWGEVTYSYTVEHDAEYSNIPDENGQQIVKKEKSTEKVSKTVTKEDFEDIYNKYANNESGFGSDIIIEYFEEDDSTKNQRRANRSKANKSVSNKDIDDEFENVIKDYNSKTSSRIDPEAAKNFLKYLNSGDKYAISHK